MKKIAIQMDPWAGLNYATDSTVLLAAEALSRGFKVWSYLPSALSVRDGAVMAVAEPVMAIDVAKGEVTRRPAERLELATMDFVLVRQDPPFDMSYITAASLLELLPSSVRVVNDPRGLREAPEKILVQRFPHLTPPTLISAEASALTMFRIQHPDVVVKPLYGHGGRDVFRLQIGEEVPAALLQSGLPIIMQKYIPAVAEGDKRILLIDGEIAGAYNRVPPPGQVRANVAAGGRAEKTELTERDREICAAVGPELKKRGLYFAGLDIIGGWLTEINVTSPTGIATANSLEGLKLEKIFWDGLVK